MTAKLSNLPISAYYTILRHLKAHTFEITQLQNVNRMGSTKSPVLERIANEEVIRTTFCRSMYVQRLTALIFPINITNSWTNTTLLTVYWKDWDYNSVFKLELTKSNLEKDISIYIKPQMSRLPMDDPCLRDEIVARHSRSAQWQQTLEPLCLSTAA